jgi:hypothetical protein
MVVLSTRHCHAFGDGDAASDGRAADRVTAADPQCPTSTATLSHLPCHSHYLTGTIRTALTPAVEWWYSQRATATRSAMATLPVMAVRQIVSQPQIHSARLQLPR